MPASSAKRFPLNLPLPWNGLAAVALLGLSLTGNPGVTAAVPAMTLAAGGAVLFLSAFLFWKNGLRPLPSVSLLVALLCLLALLSGSSSYAPYLSSVGTSALAGFLAVVSAFELGLSNRRQWRLVASLLVGVSTLSAVYGIFAWLESPKTQALSSGFTNPDCYSVIPLLGFFWALATTLDRENPLRLLCAAAVLPLVAALVLTASRAGLLGLGVGYAGFVFTLASSRSQLLRGVATKMLIPPFVVALILALGGNGLQMTEKLTRLSLGNDPVAIRSRLDVLKNCYKTIGRRPWRGAGPGCFHLAYQQDRTALSAGEDFMNVAHNDYVQWFVETGIPGGLLWIALLGHSLLKAWRSYRSPTLWVAGQVACVLGISTYCALNFACPVAADLFWIGAVLGLCGALPRLEAVAPPSSWSPKAFPLAFLLAAWGLATVRFGANCWLVSREESKAVAAEQTLDWEGALQTLERAAALQPSNYRLHLQVARLSKKAFLLSGQDRWLQDEGKALKQAYACNPRDLQVLLILIDFLEGRMVPSEAKPFVAEAEVVAPYSPLVQFARAHNQILLGQYQEAARTLVSVEKTGVTSNDRRLALLLYALEAKSPSTGVDFLRKIGLQNPDRAAELCILIGAASREAKDYPPALRLLGIIRFLAPKRADAIIELAALRGLAGESEGELKLLGKLRTDQNLDMSEADQERVWKRWSELQVKKGQFDLVLTQLEDYLISHQRQLWPRYLMADIYLRQSQKSEARTALREGIPYDVDGDLRIRLADLCAQQRLYGLARSYYREALRMSPRKALIEERLQVMKSQPDELEDELESEPGASATPVLR